MRKRILIGLAFLALILTACAEVHTPQFVGKNSVEIVNKQTNEVVKTFDNIHSIRDASG